MVSGPGLAKVRKLPLLMRRERILVAPFEGSLRGWLDCADVLSEGAADARSGTFYGSTSILMQAPSELDASERHTLLSVVAHDPHLRARALRIARREAEVRAGGSLGTVRAEISVEISARGLALYIEIEASLMCVGALAT